MAKRIHLVFGDEYLATAKAKSIVAISVPDALDPLAVETVDGQRDTVAEAVEALGRCREALGTLGFFGGGKKVVWFRGVSFLTDTPAGRSEHVKTALGRLTEMLKRGLSDGVVLVLSAPRVDKRTAFYKAMQELGEVHEFAVPDKPGPANRQRAGEVVDGALEQAGVAMSGEVREAFLEKVGNDTRTILNEVGKLATYLGKRRAATMEDMEAITSTSRDAAAWDIQDAVGERSLGKALAVARRLIFQRESPMALIALIENRLRDLIVYREALDRGWLRDGRWARLPEGAEVLLADGLGKDYHGMHPFRLGILARQAQKFSGRELARALQQAMVAHRQLVTSSVPAPMVLELLMLRILAKAPAAARTPVRGGGPL